MAPPPTFAELRELVLRDADSDEALAQLATASSVVNQLSETGDAVLGHFVDQARGSGRCWVEISNVLGVTKQAVHKRFSASRSAERRWRRHYTERARRAVDASSDVARGFQHDHIGTEHLLLALFGDPESVAAKVLAALGTDREAVTAAILQHAPRGARQGDLREAATLPMTQRETDTLSRAVDEARELGHDYVGTEHLLLALYGDPESVAAAVLAELGPSAASAKAGVIEALAQ
jgi:hypothetical protein